MSVLSNLHQRAAEHHEHAARHHREAAKLHELKRYCGSRRSGAYGGRPSGACDPLRNKGCERVHRRTPRWLEEVIKNAWTYHKLVGSSCVRPNPLVRAVDRLELLVIALAILAVLFAAACAGALGTAVHEARSSTYAAESQMRRSATATAAIATAAGASIETRANARWRLRVGAPQSHPVSQRVDPQMVWDIRSGRRVDAAHSTGQATAEAIGIACVAW